jgi:hypothetical protein
VILVSEVLDKLEKLGHKTEVAGKKVALVAALRYLFGNDIGINGPSVLEVVDVLYRHLATSIKGPSPDVEDERLLQTTIAETMGTS